VSNNAASPDQIAQQTQFVRSEMMEDAYASRASVSSATGQGQPLQEQQLPWQQGQQQNSGTPPAMYRPAKAATMGWMGTGAKVLPRHYTACEFADLVELIGTTVSLCLETGC